VILPARNDSGVVFGTERLRAMRTYLNDRDAQTLRHVSNVLYQKILTSVKDEQEVQTMVMNGRLVISANEPRSMAWLANDVQTNGKIKLADYVSFGAVGQSARTTEVSRKLGARMRGAPVKGEPGEALTLLQTSANADISDVFVHVKVSRWASDQSDLLTNPKYKGKAIIFEAPAAHAEQKIVRMLIAAMSGQADIAKFPASIWGKKRPCQGCLKALQICKDAGFNIRFDPYPGLLWKGSCDSIDAVCEFLAKNDVRFPRNQSVVDYLLNLKPTEDSHITISKYGGGKDQGAATDSESEIDDYEAEAAKAERRGAEIAKAAAKLLADFQVLKAAVETLLSTHPPPQPVEVAQKIVVACGHKLDEAKKVFLSMKAGLHELETLYQQMPTWLGLAQTDLSRYRQQYSLDKNSKTNDLALKAELTCKALEKATDKVAEQRKSVEAVFAEAGALGAKVEAFNKAAAGLVG
jgi:hypothetical protein